MLLMALLSFLSFARVNSMKTSQGMEPSTSVFDVGYALDEMPQKSQKSEDANRETDSSCEFKAVFGQLLNESLPNQLQIIHPNLDLMNYKIKIQFDSSSEWIIFIEESATLQGVPLRKYSDSNFHFMVVVFDEKSVVLRLPCTVSVGVAASVGDDNQLLADVKNECVQSGSIAVFVVEADADLDKLSAQDRIRLMTNMMKLLSLLNSINRAVALESESSSSHNTFMTGQGNALGRDDRDFLFFLSWPIACGFESIDQDVLEKLEEVALNGSLARVIGYDVTGWRIENRNLAKQRPRRLASKRGKVGSFHFANPGRDTRRASTITNFPGFPGSEAEIEEGSSNLPEEIKKSDHELQRTMIPSPPTLSSQTSNKISYTTTIVPSKSSETPQTSKTNREFPPVFIYNQTYFELRVDDLFKSIGGSKIPDPNSRESSMKLSMDDSTNCYIECDGQIISGFFTGTVANKKKSSYTLNLTTGSKKKNSPNTITFQILPRPQPISHRFIVHMTQQSQLSEAVAASRFARKLAVALEVGGPLSMRPPGRFTFLKFLNNFPRLSVSWFDNQLNSSERCDGAAIGALLSRMTGYFPKMLITEKLMAGDDFINKLKPEFHVTKIKLNLFGPCAVKESENKINMISKPPMIVHLPPFFLNQTETMYITQNTGLNDNLTPNYLPTVSSIMITIEISAFLGRLTTYKIEESMLFEESVSTRSTNLELKVLSDTKTLPQWLSLDPDTFTIVALPTDQDLLVLPSFNSTYWVWRGKLYAFDDSRTLSQVNFVDVYVSRAPSTTDLISLLSPTFTLKIRNYNLPEFTALYAQRLLEVISGLYDDVDSKNIELTSLKSGSVVVTWINSSISNIQEACSLEERSHGLLMNEGVGPSTLVYDRFMRVGFEISSFYWKKTEQCRTVTRQTTTLYPNKKQTTRKSDVFKPPTVPSSSEKNDNLTIILVAISVSIVLLFIIFLIKYRFKRRTSTSTLRLQPSNSDSFNKRGEKTQFTNAFYSKRGTPIIFTEETAQLQTEHDFNGSRPGKDDPKNTNLFKTVVDSRPAPPSYVDSAPS